MSFKRYLYILLFASFFLLSKTAHAAIPAFPGAEGFGAGTPGGRGGKVYEVTNLNDSGPGSLRACAESSGPRICVFRTGGTIDMRSAIRIENPYITIAGQTAPGGGILIKGKRFSSTPIRISTHDVVIRFIRVRTGRDSGGSQSGDTIGIENNAYNVVIDHCSVSWGRDENLQVWSNSVASHDITFSWNITSEALLNHSMGFITGSNTPAIADQMTNIDVHHNLFLHNDKRNPYVKHKTGRIVNNIVYNWGDWGFLSEGGTHFDIINNLYISGPSSSGYEAWAGPPAPGWNDSATFDPDNCPEKCIYHYVIGNKGPHHPDPSGDNWSFLCWDIYGSSGCNPVPSVYRRMSPLASPPFPISAVPVSQLEAIILPDVGASRRLDQNGNWVMNRDAVDLRLLNEYENSTGKLISDESEVGGFPTIASGTPYADSDHDGMPNDWENKYSFNPNSSSDGNQDTDGDGYTNIEEYLNGTNPRGGEPIPTNTPTSGTNIPGDANGDEKVDILDYFFWINNYNTQTPGGPQNGDFNKSGFVDGMDYIIWLNNYSG